MEIYVMRHAAARPPGSGPWRGDRERPLSPEGKASMKSAAAGLARAGVRFDRILSSPLVRAVQTARIVAEIAGGGTEIVETDQLAPGVNPQALLRSLGDPPNACSILLVGHEPDVGTLVETLAGARGAGHLSFNPGTMVRIDIDDPSLPGSGSLVWILSVESAARLAG